MLIPLSRELEVGRLVNIETYFLVSAGVTSHLNGHFKRSGWQVTWRHVISTLEDGTDPTTIDPLAS